MSRCQPSRKLLPRRFGSFSPIVNLSPTIFPLGPKRCRVYYIDWEDDSHSFEKLRPLIWAHSIQKFIDERRRALVELLDDSPTDGPSMTELIVPIQGEVEKILGRPLPDKLKKK